jgi:hypothetical protein
MRMRLITMMYFWCSLCNFLRVFPFVSVCFLVVWVALASFQTALTTFASPHGLWLEKSRAIPFLVSSRLSLSSSLSSPLSRLASSSLTIPYAPCRSSSPFLILFQWRIEGLALTIASGGTARGGGARPWGSSRCRCLDDEVEAAGNGGRQWVRPEPDRDKLLVRCSRRGRSRRPAPVAGAEGRTGAGEEAATAQRAMCPASGRAPHPPPANPLHIHRLPPPELLASPDPFKRR